MKMVIGGTFQGKLAYAKERYQITDGWIDGAVCEREALGTCKGVYHFHELIRNMIQDSKKISPGSRVRPVRQRHLPHGCMKRIRRLSSLQMNLGTASFRWISLTGSTGK